MNKKIIIPIVSLLISISAYSEGQLKHEFSIYGGGGLSTLLYSPALGTQNNGFGGLAGLGYTMFFNDVFGMGIGAEAAFYNAKALLGDFASETQVVDMEDTPFNFAWKITGYEESQKATFINIPLKLFIQSKNYHRIYGALGAKLGIPLMANGSYKGTISTSGKYEFENYEYTTQKFMGFNAIPESGDNSLKINLAYLASAEVGMKWTLSKDIVLYTGIYVDYGLNDIREGGEPFLAYNADNPKEISANSVLNAKTEGNKNFTDKVSPLAAGLKLRLAFGKNIGGTKKTKESPVTPADTVNTSNKDTTEAKAKPNKYELSADDEAEREAYLKNAKERKKKYRQALGDVNNYGLAIVTLNAVQKRTLDQYIEQLKREPGITLNIIGHTCDIGSDQLNMKIGQERADLAKDYMVENSIVPRRIRTFSRGKHEPLVPNTSEVNRKKNRRLEIIVIRPERDIDSDRGSDNDEFYR